VPAKYLRRPPKPLPYSFLLETDGSVCARFQQVAGLDVPHGTPRSTMILKRGIITGPVLWEWRRQGNVPPRGGALAMLDSSGAVRGRWKFQSARIVKWVGPELNAKGGGNATMAVLELACEGIELE
jgi:hypothetical protein